MGIFIATGKWVSNFFLVCGVIVLCECLGLIASDRQPHLVIALFFLTLSVVGYNVMTVMAYVHILVGTDAMQKFRSKQQNDNRP